MKPISRPSWASILVRSPPTLGRYASSVAIGAAITTASTCASQAGTRPGGQAPATPNAIRRKAAMKTIRPASTAKGTVKIGFRNAAASTARIAARAARRQFRASRTARRAALGGWAFVVADCMCRTIAWPRQRPADVPTKHRNEGANGGGRSVDSEPRTPAIVKRSGVSSARPELRLTRRRDRLGLVRRRLGRRELLRPRVADEAVAVGHAHVGERLRVYRRIRADDVGAREDVGAQRVDVVVAQRVGRGERHRALDVVEERRRVRPVALDRLHRRLRRVGVDEGAAAADQAVAETALQVLAVARDALRLVDRLALRDGPGALRQVAPVGQRREEARELGVARRL